MKSYAEAVMQPAPDTHNKVVGYVLWIFGFMGAHRFYLGKWATGILYLVTLGIFGMGLICDFWTLNSQVSELNRVKLMQSSGLARAVRP